MTEHTKVVEDQRKMLKAEEWSMQVAAIHTHSFSSMYYDDHPEDTEGGKMVTDVEYNCGLIKRSQGGIHLRDFGKELKGQELFDAYSMVN
jgi:hypothetical protein